MKCGKPYCVCVGKCFAQLSPLPDVALAASPAAPDSLGSCCRKEEKRIAELEAELLALKMQKPVAWASADLGWMWNNYERACAAVEGRHILTLKPLYVAAGAQEKQYK